MLRKNNKYCETCNKITRDDNTTYIKNPLYESTTNLTPETLQMLMITTQEI